MNIHIVYPYISSVTLSPIESLLYLGTSKDCSKCQCPGGSSGNQFSKTCYLDKRVTPPALVCDACEVTIRICLIF